MAQGGESTEEPDIVVEAPDSGMGDTGEYAADARRPSRPALSAPARVIGRYRELDRRDRLVVLSGLLLVILVLAILAIYYSGGGGGPPDGNGPVIVDDWSLEGLELFTASGDEENTNLEFQQTPYAVTLDPEPRQVLFVTAISIQVEWTDETTPPVQVPAPGYENQPDGFQLIIRVHEDLGEWESEIVFNAAGQPGSIDLQVDLVEELGAPIAVATREGATHLPRGYTEVVRIDLVVRTDECGDWEPPLQAFPSFPDGGNHYTAHWSVDYLVDADGRP